jgi:hypothetical protein
MVARAKRRQTLKDEVDAEDAILTLSLLSSSSPESSSMGRPVNIIVIGPKKEPITPHWRLQSATSAYGHTARQQYRDQ